MFHTIADFEFVWSQELEATQKIFKHITDRSLAQASTPEGRTIGRLAWHIVITIPEMMGKTGLTIPGATEHDPVPASARVIFKTYSDVAIALLDVMKKQWTDETLKHTDDMYGQRWTRSQTLTSLVFHQIHHRGQLTVLMRQAGLALPGIYGPAREEWAAFGMQPPVV
jgi:uncharacterized damage-inducible protein DinB